MRGFEQLVQFIRELNFDALPPETVTSAKKAIIDATGVALAGSSAAGVSAAVSLMREWSGKPESTVLVFGDKLPVFQSAFLNSMMAHALDFDDVHDKVAIHASCSVVPSALAVAESLGGLSGKDFITAVVLGVEVAARLGLSVLDQDRGWHLSAVCGAIANATVAGRLLGLKADKMVNALGIAYSQASGTLQSLIDGALTKRMQPGFAARSGILSAYLARNGLTGPVNFLDGKFGLFNLFFGGNCDPNAITENLGAQFEIDRLGSKPYPCCRLAHAAIDAVLALLDEEKFSLDEIQQIQVFGPAAMNTMCGKPYTISASSAIDAQFSLQYLLISAILKKRIHIDDFSSEAVRNPTVISHTDKVRIHVSREIKNRWGAIVKIEMKDGRFLSRRVDIPKGQPENPMTWDEHVEKFRICADHAAKPLNSEHLKQWIHQIEILETSENMVGTAQFLI